MTGSNFPCRKTWIKIYLSRQHEKVKLGKMIRDTKHKYCYTLRRRRRYEKSSKAAAIMNVNKKP